MSTAAHSGHVGLGGYITRALTSSLGAKIVMAVTGLLFLGWLVLHLLGNITFFAGSEALNKYAALLAENPPLLWGQRLLMIVIVPLHVASGLRLAALNKAARPQQYQMRQWRKATLASRTMAVSGIVVLAFLVFHLAHYTLHWVKPAYATLVDAKGRHDVYAMVTDGFSNPLIVAFYVLAMALVGMHLSHGFWSAFQSLGINGRKWTPFAQIAGRFLAWGLALAFASIAIGAFLGAAR